MSKATIWLGPGDVAPLPIGAAAGAEHPLLAPSAMYVDAGRIFFGPAALERAADGVASRRNPIVSFKLVLSAREIEPTLALKLNRSIDPTSSLTYRDALVLYLAYLDQLVRAALAAPDSTVPPVYADAPKRLTSPHWQSFGEAVRVVARLVEESAAVSRQIGARLMDREGAPIEAASLALAKASSAPATGCFEGIVLESHSAASAYLNFATKRSAYIWVIDMGAGTTDLAGFERDPEASELLEVDGTRQCCMLAGDELDNILIDLFVRRSRESKLDRQDRLWRRLRLSVKNLKGDLFSKGKSAFKHERSLVTVTRDALSRDRSFRAYRRALTKSIASSIAPLLQQAKRGGASAVTVLLAGGGANLPFLADLVRAGASQCRSRLRLDIERFGASWSLPHRHHPFAGVFPQMAIAMGGAMAPVVSLPLSGTNPQEIAAAQG
jgi:hypothetical protein